MLTPEDDRRNSTRQYNKMRIADLYTLVPQVRSFLSLRFTVLISISCLKIVRFQQYLYVFNAL